MRPGSVVIYIATYASVDRATDDLACVRRLQRDGVIAPDDSTVIAREAAGWVVRRDASDHRDGFAPGQQAVDRVVHLLFPVALSNRSAHDSPDGSAPAPAWMLDDELDELREQLAFASAAVIVVGGVQLAPVVRVALARATSMLDLNLTAEGARLAGGLLASAGGA